MGFILYTAIPADASSHFTDYDSDNDNLIEVSNLDQLNAIRWDLDGNGDPASANTSTYNAAFPNRVTGATGRMGCPATCTGYELFANLNFDTDNSGSVTSADSYPNWAPIGGTFGVYTATFDGNARTIRNLTITGTASRVGLFTNLGVGGVIRDVAMIDASVSGGSYVGILVGRNNSGLIYSVSIQGGSVTHTGTGSSGGGVAGYSAGTIRASYSTASVSGGSSANANVGGLVGHANNGTTTASYAAGTVTGTGTGAKVGGLAGQAVGTSTTITLSYCDTSTLTPTTTPCVGGRVDGATVPNTTVPGKTTAELQSPTGYTGIYANWNLSLDSDDYPDNPWNFGTSSQYPTLNTPAQRQTAADYDSDDDGLIDIDTLHQLNAIRHDLNGDGLPAATSTYAAYAAAFPGGDLEATSTRMGCVEGCAGYELTGDLDFDADGVGGVTSTDPYPNWAPIGGVYATVFDGGGHSITNLTITGSSGNIGLFNTLGSSGAIRDLGIIDASVSGGGGYTGALAGLINGGGAVTAVSIQEGSVTFTGGNGGGLAGSNSGVIRASWSTASVDGGSGGGVNAGGLTGLESNGSIIASYAAGAVTATGAVVNRGGLTGRASGASTVITDSYCNTSILTPTTTPCVGDEASNADVTVAGKTTAELQTPETYTGIYRNWNLSVDADVFPDNPWNFGATTTYPTLKTPTQRQAAVAVDYDADNDGLIDVNTLDKLNAIRHDLNGDGLPDSTSTGIYPAYAGAFPDGDLAATATRMGCPSGCAGYELTADLDFDDDGSPGVTAADSYPNWNPIAGIYTATFNGRGRTIRNLTITSPLVYTGLFATLASGGVIRDVGIIDASVTGSGLFVGILAGRNIGAITAVSVQGGSVAATVGSARTGGLAGFNSGVIRASYSTASVDGGPGASALIGGLIGWDNNGTTTASYAAGAVSGTGSNANVGGFVGQIAAGTVIEYSYCDTTVHGTTTPACIGSGTAATVEGKTATELKAPYGYMGIYANWNLDLNNDNTGDYPWYFGTTTTYPTLNTPTQRQAQRTGIAPPPPPQPPTSTPPTSPTSTPSTSTPPTSPTSTPSTSTPPTSPTSTAPTSTPPTSPTSTAPTSTPPTTPTSTPATSTPPTSPTSTPATSTPPDSGNGGNGGGNGGNGETGGGRGETGGDTSPPPAPPPAVVTAAETVAPYDAASAHPEIYNNTQYEMTATCQTHNPDPETGDPRSATLTFNLGTYTGPILLTLSIWRNERYMAYETQDIPLPTLERNDQTASVRVETDPAQTRFRLDGRRHGLAFNLVLGYADCRVDGGP